MKKALTLFVFAAFVATQSFATYIVVLKDGTKYAAKAKWTVVNGKAIVQLENGQSLQLDPALIDVARSEQMTKIGMANANVVDLDAGLSKPAPKQEQPSLSNIKLRPRKIENHKAPAAPATAPANTVAGAPAGEGGLSTEVLNKFELAYENVGIFDRSVTSTSPRTIRAELTVDTEERVFNAISATSYLMVRNAGVPGIAIDTVELFMKTTSGGAAGRFQMTRADAQAINQRTISQQDYFVKKVIY